MHNLHGPEATALLFLSIYASTRDLWRMVQQKGLNWRQVPIVRLAELSEMLPLSPMLLKTWLSHELINLIY